MNFNQLVQLYPLLPPFLRTTRSNSCLRFFLKALSLICSLLGRLYSLTLDVPMSEIKETARADENIHINDTPDQGLKRNGTMIWEFKEVW